MKIYANQLPQHLSKGIHPCYMIFGDEPFQIYDCRNQVKRACKQHGFEEVIRLTDDDQFDWNELLDHCNAMSLFSSTKLIELELTSNKVPKAGSEILKTISGSLSTDTVLVLFGPKLDANQTRSAWFKALSDAGLYIPVYDIEGHHLQRWLQQQLAERQIQMTAEAQQYLLDYTAGNLLACAQELEKLKMTLGENATVNIQQISRFVADQSRYNVFQLMDSLWHGDSEQCLNILNRLKGEELEPNIILWALQKDVLMLSELQQALQYQSDTKEVFNQYKVWKNKQQQFLNLAQRIPVDAINTAIDWLSKTDVALKQFTTFCPYSLIAQTCLLLTGKGVSQIAFPVGLEA